MSSPRLEGKTVLVTGSGSGIGRSVATRFVQEGARVVFTDRNLQAAEEAREESGGDSIAVELDVSSEPSCRQGFEVAISNGFSPNVVIANAGIQLFGRDNRVAELDLAVWHETLTVNLTGTFLTLKYAVRAMSESGGSIVVTGSPTALGGSFSDFTAYSSSKGGVHSLAMAVAGGYAERGIRVNTVIPGYIETPLVSSVVNNPEARAGIVAQIPLKRPGQATDIEGVMIFLASDESSFATGGFFVVDGGLTTI
jgi:NAD(P)-dependent dehydrogenase (short-subunit alcohol dehydrogenase family)